MAADLAETLPPMTFVLARRYRHRFKSGMRLFLSKNFLCVSPRAPSFFLYLFLFRSLLRLTSFFLLHEKQKTSQIFLFEHCVRPKFELFTPFFLSLYFQLFPTFLRKRKFSVVLVRAIERVYALHFPDPVSFTALPTQGLCQHLNFFLIDVFCISL